MVSWQKVQQNRMLRRRERERKEIKLVYGLNDQTIDVETYPSQASFGRMSRSGGGSQIISPIYEEPAEPDPWFAFEFLGALFGPPPQRVAIRAPATYRVRRPLSRKVSLKGERGRETWSIARAVPVATWACEPYCPDSPIGLRGCDLLEWLSRRVLVHVHDDHLEEFLAIKRRSGRELLGLLTPRRTARPNHRQTGPATVSRGRIINGEFVRSHTPVCAPTHSGRVLFGICRGILPDVEMRWALYCRALPSRRFIWMALPQSRQGPQRLIQPYTRRRWPRWPVKETETLLDTQVPDGPRLYFVRPVNRS